jgi:aminomethyltransferase
MASKRTPLYEVHESLGARMIDFHGWMLPVQYGGVVEEHLCVREKAGLFDISHMGEFLVFGSKATEFVNQLVTNDASAIGDGQCMYTPMCHENGSIVDDLVVYKHNQEHYMLVVNAANIEKDYGWIESNMEDVAAEGGVEKESADEECHDVEVGLRDVSDNTAMLALQGPKAWRILQKVCDMESSAIKRFRFRDNVMVGDVKALVSRTGYTGEDGFEFYVNPHYAVDVWKTIMDAGGGEGIKPAGLGARDTLRLEAGLMLYGNDIDDTTTPLEAGIEWTVKLGKEGFIGKDELLRENADGVEKRLVGFELAERGVPRQGYRILAAEDETGRVTSGTYSPTLKRSIGLGYVKPEHSALGTGLDVVIRDRPRKANVVDLPFYKR